MLNFQFHESIDPPAKPQPEPTAAQACYHCGLAVVEPGRFRGKVLGLEREFCCVGCQSIARTIASSGFERYYETREAHEWVADRTLPQDLPSAAIYDDPLAQRQFVSSDGGRGREAALILDRIRCAACVWLNEHYLRSVPGVTAVTINYATRRALVSWDESRVRLSQIIDAVRALGYDAFPYDPHKQVGQRRSERREALWRLFVAGFGAMQVMMYAVPRYIDDTGTLSFESDQLMRWASLVLTIPVMLFACGPFFSNAISDLRGRRLSIDTPISVGILAAFAASCWATLTGTGEVYFDSISMLVFLLLGARYLEMAARQKAAGSLDRLLRWMPEFACRLTGSLASGVTERIEINALRSGDAVLIAPGETIPADGTVQSGASSVDESLLTGESRPVAKSAGDSLIGGAINIEQPLVMRVTGVGVDTKAAAIGRLIERAAASKPRLVALADRIGGYLTWVVMVSSLAAFVGWGMVDPAKALWVAIAVLVVTCPCALALAAPIALTAATGRLSARGIVLTRSSAMEAAARLTDVVLDKTGTLTEGHLSVARIAPLGHMEAAECVAVAAAMEAGSIHPVAKAMFAAAGDPCATVVTAVVHYPGHGVEGHVEGRRLRLGTKEFVAEIAGPAPIPTVSEAHRTPIYLGEASGWLAIFELEDSLKAAVLETIAGLRGRGLRIHLLSGDAISVVSHYAGKAGIYTWTGQATPQDKHAYVVGLQQQGRCVAMVGDGVNDAPVLAQADVSIAMGQGAPLAQMQSDFVLLSGRIEGIELLIEESSIAMKSIRQNFNWALGYNAVALPLAVAGFVGPWEAAIGMAASSFVVVLNALRLLGVDRSSGKLPTALPMTR